MTIQSTYQPFLIGQGKSRSGYFTYYDSWVKPEDAYDTLINAYVYRGSLYQRNGFTLFPSTAQAGALVYQNNEIVTVGNGGSAYGSTLTNRPLIGTVTVTALTVAGKRTATAAFAAGDVPLVGALAAGASTINFTTGVWVLNTTAAVAANIPIVIQYNYIPTNLTSNAGISVNNPIMGIKQFINETTNTNVLVVMDTRRASFWDPGAKTFTPLAQFQQFFYQFKSPNTGPAFTSTNNGNSITLQWTNIAPYTVSVTSAGDTAGGGVGTVTDVPTNSTTGTFTASGNITGGTINYVTGQIVINFAVAPTALTTVQITASLQGDYFTGNNTNFFNATNWNAPDTPAFLYMTNNVDFITTFNGTTLGRPAFGIYATSVTIKAPSQVLLPFKNDIAKCIDIKVFQNSLLLLRPTIFSDGSTVPRAFAENQAIYYSCPTGNLSFSPTNFVLGTEIAGNGGFVEASTGDIIQSASLIRDALIVFFTNSTFLFRGTNNPVDPLRFFQLNNSRSTNAPYGNIDYDSFASSMGAKGLIICDGVGVERYDEEVIDLFENINQNAFGQCNAARYDAQNQAWMLYPSTDKNINTSDKIMVYNFLEKTWAIYIPNLGNLIQTPTSPNTLSCLGLGFTTQDITWNDFAAGGKWGPAGLAWDQANFAWNTFLVQDLTPSLLAGDQNGFVYIADDGPTDNLGPAATTPLGIPTQVITKRLSPFAHLGEKCRFGYVDIYYQVNPQASIRLNIYCNNSNIVYRTFTFTLDWTTNGNVNPDAAPGFAWKRFYINVVGEFVQIELNSQIDTVNDAPVYNMKSPFKILGMILWAAPAGRLTPGTFL